MDSPVVTSLGHAGLRIDAPGLSMLCDPWMSPGGAFMGSWFPFPDNSHLRTPEVLDADWVAISHEHLNHLDLGLLRRLAPHVRLVIPRYPAPEMYNRIRAAGIRNVVVELDNWERFQLNERGDWVTVVQEQSPMCHDSAILVVAAGHSILHTNDARLSVAQLRRVAAEAGRPPDLMGMQMSGASWHPICYSYPSEVVRSISESKRLGKFKAVSRLLRSAPPRIALPHAGPPCFLDPSLQHHNAHCVRPASSRTRRRRQASSGSAYRTKPSSPCCPATGSTWARAPSTGTRAGTASRSRTSTTTWPPTPNGGATRWRPSQTPRSAVGSRSGSASTSQPWDRCPTTFCTGSRWSCASSWTGPTVACGTSSSGRPAARSTSPAAPPTRATSCASRPGGSMPC